MTQGLCRQADRVAQPLIWTSGIAGWGFGSMTEELLSGVVVRGDRFLKDVDGWAARGSPHSVEGGSWTCVWVSPSSAPL
jgi:hypothetical protein